MSNIVADSVSYFEKRLADGFQVEDLSQTALYIGKRLVREAVDAVPGASGKEKSAWVKAKLYEVVDQLSEAARPFFTQGIIGLFAAPLVEIIKQAGHTGVEWVMANFVDPFLQWAYALELADPESPVTSNTLKAATA